jgi:hypothetical protein
MLPHNVITLRDVALGEQNQLVFGDQKREHPDTLTHHDGRHTAQHTSISSSPASLEHHCSFHEPANTAPPTQAGVPVALVPAVGMRIMSPSA